jgi:hypothetical protein
MSLAATGALASAAFAAVHTTTSDSAIAVSSEHQDANESSFAMAESLPQYKILPVPGGLLKPVDSVEGNTVLGDRNADQMLDSAAMYLTGNGLAVLSVFLIGFMFMGVLSKAREFFGSKPDGSDKKAKTSAEFVPFVRRSDAVSPLNPVRIMGEELPGKPADTSASSRIFGRRGIQ